MKITDLFLSDYLHFKNFHLNLTNGNKPLEKICLLGKNGTGKTTLLNLIRSFLIDPILLTHMPIRENPYGFIFEHEGNVFFSGLIAFKEDKHTSYSTVLFNLKVKFSKDDDNYQIIKKHFMEFDAETFNLLWRYSDIYKSEEENITEYLKLNQTFSQNQGPFNNKYCLIYSPCESILNKSLNTDLCTSTRLDSALSYFTNFPFYHELSFTYLENFWNLVIYQVKKRERDELGFKKLEENAEKTLKKVNILFEQQYPNFLKILAEKWNLILDVVGLYFDYENAKIPVQLNDNLIALFKTKTDNKNISYHQLSTGIRHLLFRLGYLVSLFYKNDIKSAIALFDEPENSLFPDVLYDVIEIYTSAAPNSQFFFATHSPIIAAQFKPDERIILDFNSNKNVIWSRGIAPEGDDPNDLLVQDFARKNLMNKTGIEKWYRFLELKKMLKKTEISKEEKDNCVREYMELGTTYKFNK